MTLYDHDPVELARDRWRAKVKAYVVAVALVLGFLSWIGLGAYLYWDGRQDDRNEQALATQYRLAATKRDYRSCLDRNDIKATLGIIVQATIALPVPQTIPPKQRAQRQAFRDLLKAQLRDLRPYDCPAILQGGPPP